MGGLAATIAAWFEADLLASILVAAGVVIVAMRTIETRVRLAPILIVLSGLAITIVAAGPARTWF